MEEKQEELLYEIVPKFNLIYELGMPTGKKILTSIITLVVFVIITVVVFLNEETLSFGGIQLIKGINTIDILKILCFVFILIVAIRLIVSIVFQSLQYKYIKYSFYSDHMIYEDNFLNQHKKNIQYTNIREIEIRRTVWDRILGKGIIVIYTNAENEYSNGLILYSIGDTQKHYEIIDKIVNKDKNNEVQSKMQVNEIIDNIPLKQEKDIQTEKDFKDSLKEIK